jgi:hypothetical protein
MFFESRGWLDSDCEDDFHSVNGGNHITRHAYQLSKERFHSSPRVLYSCVQTILALHTQKFIHTDNYYCAGALVHAVPF